MKEGANPPPPRLATIGVARAAARTGAIHPQPHVVVLATHGKRPAWR